MNNSKISERFAEGRTTGKGSNMYIAGDTIYSYGSHFPIARTINDNTALFTTRSYSNSTAKHKNHVYHALCEANYKIISVDNVSKDLSTETLAEYEDNILDYMLKAKRARKEHNKAFYQSQVEEARNDYKFIQSLI